MHRLKRMWPWSELRPCRGLDPSLYQSTTSLSRAVPHQDQKDSDNHEGTDCRIMSHPLWPVLWPGVSHRSPGQALPAPLQATENLWLTDRSARLAAAQPCPQQAFKKSSEHWNGLMF